MKIFVSIISIIFLAGCGTDGAGLTQLESWTTLDENGNIVSCYMKFTDGKERDGGVTATGTICNQPFSYNAGSERAFEAFRINAAAQKASLEVAGKIIPEVVNAFVSAYTGTAALGAVSEAVAAKAGLEAARAKAEAMKAQK